MAAPVRSTHAGIGWVGRTTAVLAMLTATAVSTTAPAYAPAAVVDGNDSIGDTFTDTVFDAQGGSGSDALYVVVVPASTADFSVLATGPSSVAVGSRATYHVALTNLAAAVSEATLTDHLPAGFRVRTVDHQDCEIGYDHTLSCPLTVAGLVTESVTVEGTFVAAGEVENTATSFSDGDVNPGNDRSSARTKVTG